MSFSIRPYIAVNSGISSDEALYRNDLACKNAAENFKLNNIAYYEKVLQSILNIHFCDIRKMCDFMDPVNPDKVAIGMRHDVDHDLVMARSMSKLEKQMGIEASYYLLHSHPFVTPAYYADFDHQNKCFLRHESLSEIYLELQANGSEIGLHVDGVRLYQQGIDGCQGIVTELNWLRKQGLKINGIAAHGSAQAYEIENFEFFNEYKLSHQNYLEFKQISIPLGTLSAKDLGIRYEANYASDTSISLADIHKQWSNGARDPDPAKYLWFYLYKNLYCRWGADIICWLYSDDCWAVSDGIELWCPQASLANILSIIKKSFGKRVLFHIHPFYLGLR